MNKKSLAAITLLVICLFPVLAQAWDGKKDNKPVAELELMNEDELAVEASVVCIVGTIEGQAGNKNKKNLDSLQIWGEALEYLQTIQRVVRKKHGGASPPWTQQIIQVPLDYAPAEECRSIMFNVRRNKEKKGQKKQAQ